MYKIAVCDDEEAVSAQVKELITEWNPSVDVVCFSSGEELLENYQSYEAVFLDIDMAGMNGIETGKAIRKMDKDTKIIYLTAYRDYVSGAFGVHAFQYLLKPVNKKAIWNVLEEIFRYTKAAEKKIILDFHTVDGSLCLPVERIYFFEYENRKIRIVTDEEQYYMSDKIGNVAKRMAEFGFSMPHQSFVVNMFHVKNVKNQQIFLDNGMEIPLSQKKQKIWKQELMEYLSRRLEGRGEVE
ncbi:MAG: response regulator transcription factor [Clostridiales bacterium]|nr:response regulator transcription factor [Clostridiales bacterium]